MQSKARNGKARGRPGALEALVTAFCALVLLVSAACEAPQDILPAEGLVQLEAPEMLTWTDVGDRDSLFRAIEQSIAYYSRLDAAETFQYGDLVYSPAEMIASMRMFQEEYLAAPSPDMLSYRIAARFHVFESIREGGRENNLFTGYYEPEYPASTRPRGRLKTPVYEIPRDLVRVQLERFREDLPPVTLKGRLKGGELVPYYSRREIQGRRAIRRKARIIAYMDEVDLFFLQIQGSGILRFGNGRRMKLGYAAGNGHPYNSIGALMVRRNIMPLEEVSLQSIRAYLRENPRQIKPILYHNPSYVFFKKQEDGPLGLIRVPLTPGRSIATDSRVVPRGGLAYVSTEMPAPFQPNTTHPFRRFMVVQDTGGAIKGHGRVDLFWGSGKDAEWKAGHQRTSGRVFYLVAKKEYLRQVARND